MAEITRVNLEEKLKEYFGYNTFRSNQIEIIEAVLSRNDVLTILPTGAGKSLCYQLPAMMLPGTAVVISPLISLMQDQVVSLFKNGISAAFLNSSLHPHDIQNVLNNLSDYKLLYVAPERFADPTFLQKLKDVNVSLFVIDEAHCISQWGHSFRNEYRKLSLLRENFPKTPIIALTATATPEVEKDIIQQLAMKDPIHIKGSFDRPNLTIRVNQKISPDKQIIAFIDTQKDKSGIIYAATRKSVDATFLQLQQAGMSVGRYHAGMSDQERSASQNAFLHDNVQIMVATVAFGMGIHKPDIRFIVHLDMPKTIEQYYQEIGRGGRDGLPAECLMLYGAQDIIIYNTFLDNIEDPIIRRLTKSKTEKMYSLCTSQRCRRIELLSYFGERYHSNECMACDNCVDDVEMIDGTVVAQKILSCVFRLKQNFGIRTVIDVLRGSKSQAILDRGHDQLSTYGILAEATEKEVRYYIESLIHMKILTLTEGEYPVLKWTETSKEVIEGTKLIEFKKKIFKEVKVKETSSVFINFDQSVFNALRAMRTEIAQEEKVPPYVVFSDRSLQEMSVYFPKNQHEFTRINGVGPIKWNKYGERFINKIRELAGDRPSLVSEKAITSPLNRVNSTEETVILFRSGHTIDEIASKRQLVKSTVLTHIDEAIQAGATLDISALVTRDKRDKIEKAIAEVGAEKLTPIKQILPEDITYDEIRLVAAFHRRTSKEN
ncbi:MAG: DNA helicase RecQ [Parachlamydiaceae bacterium]|nr:DNA helicase RecQ [Parachlamydiaceae bacterium]